MNLAIILINFYSDKHTLECLKSLRSLKWQGKLQIFVVNNASKKNFNQSVKKRFPRVLVINPQTNLGFGVGNNHGVKKAKKWGADLLMILNNDTIVHPQLANNLAAALKQTHAHIAVPKIYFEKGFEFHQDRYKKNELGKVIWYAGGHIDWDNVLGIHDGVDEVDRGQFNQSKLIEFATGCCMLIKKEVIDKIGLFNDKYFLYLEDADFSLRARRAGFSIRYQPEALLWHKNAESTGGSGSPLQDYFLTRNRLHFGMKYAPLRTKFALLREGLRLLISGRSWQRRGVLDFFLGRFGRGSYPIKK